MIYGWTSDPIQYTTRIFVFQFLIFKFHAVISCYPCSPSDVAYTEQQLNNVNNCNNNSPFTWDIFNFTVFDSNWSCSWKLIACVTWEVLFDHFFFLSESWSFELCMMKSAPTHTSTSKYEWNGWIVDWLDHCINLMVNKRTSVN